MESKKVFRILSVIIALFIWQILSLLINSKILIASPIMVIARFGTIWREKLFWSSITFTLVRICIGYLCGVLIAVTLGILAEKYKYLEILLWPYMVMIKSVPVASIVVICLIWLSASNISVLVSMLIVIPIIYNNVLIGLKNRDSELEEVACVYDVKGIEKIRTVLLPQLCPYLISACSVTAGMVWKAGVAAEVIGTPAGSIGRQLYLSKTYLDTVDMFVWTITIVIISVAFEKAFMCALKYILKKWCGTES